MEEILRQILNKLDKLDKEIKADIKELKEGQNSLKKDIKDLSVMTGDFANRFDTIEAKLDEQGLIVNRLASIVRVNSAKSRNLEERIEYLEEVKA